MITIRFEGHENILGTHFNTFEFTKDSYLTKKGDCIIGVNSVFEFGNLAQRLKENRAQIKIRGIISVNFSGKLYQDEFFGILNPNFDVNSKEIVFRKSNFDSPRTIAIRCNKSARELNRKMIQILKNPDVKGVCKIYLE